MIQTETCSTHLPQRPLKEALETILPFTKSKYPARRGIETSGLENTVLLDFTENHLVFTDFVSLLRYPIKQSSKDILSLPLKGRYIIHVDFAKELKDSLYKNSKSPVKTTTSKEAITFSTDKGEVKAILVENDFPEYKSFLTEGWENQVCFEFQRDSLLHLVESYSTSNGSIALNIKSGKLTLSEISGGEISEGHYFEHAKGECPSEGLRIGLNYKYLLSSLKKQKSSTVNLIIRDPSALYKECWNNSAFLVKGSMEVYLAPLQIN